MKIHLLFWDWPRIQLRNWFDPHCKDLMERYTAALKQDRESAQNMIDLVQGVADRILVGDVGNTITSEHGKILPLWFAGNGKEIGPMRTRLLLKAYQLCIEDNRILAHVGWAEISQ